MKESTAVSKTSFVLHIESLDILNELSDPQAGMLFKAIKAWHRGEEVELPLEIRMCFLPFKNQFIRDLSSWNEYLCKQSELGRAGALIKKQKKQKKQKKPPLATAFHLLPPQADANEFKQQQADANELKQPQADANELKPPQTTESLNKNKNKSVNDSKVIPPNPIKGEYENFILKFNELTKKKFRGRGKPQSQFNARLKDGFTVDDILRAVVNCASDEYHVKNPHYLTPEFITKSDKLEKYLNWQPPKKEPEKEKSYIDKVIDGEIPAPEVDEKIKNLYK